MTCKNDKNIAHNYTQVRSRQWRRLAANIREWTQDPSSSPFEDCLHKFVNGSKIGTKMPRVMKTEYGSGPKYWEPITICSTQIASGQCFHAV